MPLLSRRFEEFVVAFTDLVERADDDEQVVLADGARLLAELVRQDDWLPQDCAMPDPQFYRQYRLHVDPQARFSVVSFVWGPGQKTPIHDHTVWGLIGMLRGAERSESFAAAGPGQPMRRVDEEILRPGDVGEVSPRIGDVHRVSNLYEDRMSISIHVYGGDIGAIRRHVFDPQTGECKTFVSGYSNRLPAP